MPAVDTARLQECSEPMQRIFSPRCLARISTTSVSLRGAWNRVGANESIPPKLLMLPARPGAEKLLSKWEPRHNALSHSDKKRGEGWLWWHGNAATLDFAKLRTIGDEEADALVARLIHCPKRSPRRTRRSGSAGQLEGLLQSLFAWTPASNRPMPAAADAFLREPNVPSGMVRSQA